LAVKDFEKFQHYKDRHPPWIKLYRSLLDDDELAALPEAAQMQLVKLWLVASTCDNRILFDRRRIVQRIGAKSRLYLDELIAGGWLLIVEENASEDASNGASNHASNALGLTRADARSREVEGETETEKEQTKPPTTAREQNSRSGRQLLLDELQPSQRPAMRAEIDMLKAGEHLPPGYGVPTDAQIDQACRECVASVPAGQIKVNRLRNFLREVMRPTLDAPRNNPRSNARGAAGWDEVK
jgi:hypothetical protein